jgi:hypothetical protein
VLEQFDPFPLFSTAFWVAACASKAHLFAQTNVGMSEELLTNEIEVFFIISLPTLKSKWL